MKIQNYNQKSWETEIRNMQNYKRNLTYKKIK